MYGALEILTAAQSEPSLSTPWRLQSDTDSPLEDALRDLTHIKLKLFLSDYNPTVPMQALTRGKLEGTDITLFQNAATQQLSHLHFTASMLCSQNIPEQAPQQQQKGTARVKVAAVGELLREVWGQLWLSRAVDLECGIVLPVGLRVNNIEYCAGKLCCNHCTAMSRHV